jgi:hydroxymethylpyrimidine pyrophosphatase-like HAD family hydrolase
VKAVILHALAVDYDGTIAENGRVHEATAAALARVRESGRRVLLVTGRMLPDLRHVCPDAERMFDAIVAENGAVLYLPERREVKRLGDPPEPALLEALQRRRIAFDVGESIIATNAPYAEASLAAIREAGVERTLIFNKGSLMLLPGGVTKGTGLTAALAAMELSAHNLAGIGDAENDHAFLGMCECAVAVADAIPALKERADHVTRSNGPGGVVEFVDQHLLEDGVRLVPRLARHHLELGRTADDVPVTLPAHGTRLLIVGPSATGKSSLTGLLVERLFAARRSLCLLDPEGDHQSLADLEGVVTLGGTAQGALPSPDELARLLRARNSGLVLNLSSMSMSEKVEYATRALGAVAAVRTASGQPHWLVVDEVHHIAPAEGSPAAEMLRAAGGAAGVITLSVDLVARDVWPEVTAVASTHLESFQAALAVLRAGGRPLAVTPDIGATPLERGEAVLATLDGQTARAVRFRVGRRQVQHQRHVRKYTEGELPPERSFFFRGPSGSLKLRAANLKRFAELAEGVDEDTWLHHLRLGHYSAWMREMIKDAELADEVAALERGAAQDGAESRRLVLDALRRRYTV